MYKAIASLLSTLIVFQYIATPGYASEALTEEAMGYNLSMAGALINNKCEQSWEQSGYVSRHACNYEFAQLYNLDISSAHFAACASASGGDIVQIADCMVARFNAWIIEQ